MSGVTHPTASAEFVEYRGMLARFQAIVLDWRLTTCETAALLRLPPDACMRLGRVETVSVDTETQMRRVIDVAGLVGDLLGDAGDCAEWLRRPNPGIIGRLLPLDVMCDGGDGLRLLRDALREEAAESGGGVAWARS